MPTANYYGHILGKKSRAHMPTQGIPSAALTFVMLAKASTQGFRAQIPSYRQCGALQLWVLAFARMTILFCF